MLTGQVPFVADTPITLIAKVLEETPTAPRATNPDVPPALDALVLRCLAKSRDDRPRTAGELYEELARIG